MIYQAGNCCCGPCKTQSGPGYIESTVVDDYNLDGSGDPVTPGGIPPYPRNPESMPGGAGCPAAPDCTHASPSANPQCGPWRPYKFSKQPPSGLLSSVDVSTMFNDYTVSGATLTSDRTCAKGQKVLQALKRWHGRYGFLSENFGPYTALVLDSGTYTDYPTSFCVGEKMTPDQVKYLSVAAVLDFAEEFPCGVAYSRSGTFDGKVTVAKTSGLRTLDWNAPASDFPIGSTGLSAFNAYCAQLASLADGNINTIAADFLSRLQSMHWGVADYAIAKAGNTWTETNTALGLTTRIITLDLDAGHFEDITYGNKCTNCECALDLPGDTHVWDVLTTETFDITNTTITWSILDVTDMVTTTLECEVTLDDEYGWSEVQDAAEALITDNHYDLDDDLVYPWRRDGYFSIGPRLLFCEVAAAIPPVLSAIPLSGEVTDFANPTAGTGTTLDPYTAWGDRAWFDENVYAWSFPSGSSGTSVGTLEGPFYDGSVVGKPGAIGANTFGWDQRNHDCCGSPETSFIKSYGATAHSSDGDAASAVVPKTAAIWTDLTEAAQIPPGNVVMHFGGGCLVQKTVQLDAATKGQNWARPCGSDSALMDEGTVRCILEASCIDFDVDLRCIEALFKLDVGVLADPGIAVGWKMTVVNETDMEGLWTVTAVDTSTLDEVHVTATLDADLPVGFERGEESVMGRRRFPDAAACNATWDHRNRRGDYVVLSWGMEYRYQERDRVIALAVGDCPAAAGAIRTNPINDAMGRMVETFTATPHGSSDGLGSAKCRVLEPETWPTTTADERYGTVLFQSVVMNVMAEVFWQAPAKSCAAQAEEDSLWTEDPLATCQVDDPGTPEFFFPHRPLVGMRISPPPGVTGWSAEGWGGYSITPASGDKIYLGFVALSYTGSVTGLPVAPPLTTPTRCAGELADEQLSPLLVPWRVVENGCNCITDEGRFEEIYAEQIGCCA